MVSLVTPWRCVTHSLCPFARAGARVAVVAERGSASHDGLGRHLSRGNQGWVPRASAVLVVAAQLAPDEHGEGGYKPFHAEYDAGQAAAQSEQPTHFSSPFACFQSRCRPRKRG